MALGKGNYQNLGPYTLLNADMELFQTYMVSNFKERLLAERSKGVLYGCRATVVSALTVNISAGLVLMPDGQLVTVPSSNITLSTADPTNPRIDRIEVGYTATDGASVVDVNNVPRVLDIQYIPALAKLTGTPAGSPTAPAATGSKVSLALVSVAATQTVLIQGNISQIEDAGFDASSIWLGNKNYQIRANQALNSIQFNLNGAGWQSLGSGGGGGGGANWQGVAGLAPTEDYEYDEKVWKFAQGGLQAITLWVKVPSSYLPGSPITLKMSGYSPGSSNNYKIQSLATLIRNGTDAITSTTNQKTVNSGDVLLTLANKLTQVSYALTETNGLINAVNVAAGDIIKVQLSRIAPTGTEDTNDVRLIPSTTEVLFS